MTMNQDDKRTLTPKLRFPEFRDGSGWEENVLGQVAEFYKGKGISKAEIDLDGKLQCIRYGELYTYYGEVIDNVYSRTNAQRSDLVLSRKNDVIIPASGETKLDIAKASCILRDDVALGSDLNIIRSVHDGRFLSYYLNGPKKLDIAQLAQGDTVVHLYPSKLEKLTLAFPSKIEQQRIADCLCSLDEVIAAQARELAASKAYKKALTQQLFPCDDEGSPRLRFPEFQNAPEWKCWKFYDLLDAVLDFRGRTPQKLGMEWGNGSIISLSANNVKNGFIDYKAECYLGSEELYSRWMGGVNLEKGDIVFTMEAPMGNALLVPDSRKYILSQRVVAFKTNDQVDNPFLVQLIWGEGFQKVIGKLGTGSTAKGISQKTLQSVSVRLPEKDEQKRIADCLSTLDRSVTANIQKLNALKAHKNGLMQQLFPSPVEDEG
jgi:type I restriction enzyme S subunit